MNSQNPNPTDEAQCDPDDIRTHDWSIWTIYFMKCQTCGQYTPRDSYIPKIRQIEETDRNQAQYGR